MRLLLLIALVLPTFAEEGSPRERLVHLLEDVVGSTAHRYGAKDDQGNGLDTLKVINDPRGGYLGVYHARIGDRFVARVARSADVVTWKYAADLEEHASQPTIARLSDGSFLVAYEKDSGAGSWVRFRRYADVETLCRGVCDGQFDARRTLSPACEGTPNILRAELSPDLAHSRIEVGLHYFRNVDVDRQAVGVLTDFHSWKATVDNRVNGLFEKRGIGGNVGGRDVIVFEGKAFTVYEAQGKKGDWGSWRCYLYDAEKGDVVALQPKTNAGSKAFGNPKVTAITSPSGKPALAVTYFLFGEGAADGEGGPLLFYTEIR